MDEIDIVSPIFVPRLNFATANSELAGKHLDWLDCAEFCNHLIIAFAIRGAPPHLAFVVLNADWEIAAVLQVPVVLELHDSKTDSVGIIGHGSMCILKADTQNAEFLLATEQSWHRRYPGNPAVPCDGGTILSASDATWYRIKCQFLGGLPLLSATPELVERGRRRIRFLRVGLSGYWLSNSRQLPPCLPRNSHAGLAAVDTPLEVSEACSAGLPNGWAPTYAADTSENSAERLSITGARPYDERHILLLISEGSKLSFAVLSLEDKKISKLSRIPIPSGRHRLSWSWSPSFGGSIWYSVSNGKLSAKKRDTSLWRVDYGPNLTTAKRPSDAIRVVRLTDDRVVASHCVLDYGAFALAMWQNGINIKKPNPMRCVLYRRTSQEASKDPRSRIPNWEAYPSDGFLESLPMKDAYDSRWMGRPVTISETQQFPFLAFGFNGRRCAAARLWRLSPLRTELILGQITGADRTQLDP